MPCSWFSYPIFSELNTNSFIFNFEYLETKEPFPELLVSPSLINGCQPLCGPDLASSLRHKSCAESYLQWFSSKYWPPSTKKCSQLNMSCQSASVCVLTFSLQPDCWKVYLYPPTECATVDASNEISWHTSVVLYRWTKGIQIILSLFAS